MKFYRVALLLGFMSLISTNMSGIMETKALADSGDAFELSDHYYDENTSFVYTADLRFNSGQAGGLVFGGTQDEEYFVFNFDRYENKVKLLHFDYTNGKNVVELIDEPFIGNYATTEHEYALINPKVREINKVNLKVIISVEDDAIYGEFFADNIKRFGIDLDYKFIKKEYKGGYLGLNCFNSDVYLENVEIGKSDYSYYTELYRNQYHFSQFANWNNDPNGLVYFNGYYHVYYQTHPYSKYWSDMYWGHARSVDLVHWELLPICLFPDTSGLGLGGGNGYMWSGSAMVYHKGMSSAIDSLNWFTGDEGLLGYYTRDGERQDQVIMTSEDGNVWIKRKLIPQVDTANGKKDCRDPIVFPVKENNDTVTLWGMILSGDSSNCMWFLKSTDLINWENAGSFYLAYENCGSHTLDVGPECPNIAFVDGKAVLTISSRHYIVGNISYNESNGNIEFIDLNNRGLHTYALGEAPIQIMDYGVDSYASQTFFIDDPTSEYYGKEIGMNWFSGVPNYPLSAESGMFAQVRTNWNGGGLTIPVIYGLNEDNQLTQTPITYNNDKYHKTNIVNVSDVNYTSESENILEDVDTHIFELDAKIANPNKNDVSFKINIGNDEYTEIGWNKNDGYYVDRSHTSDAGIGFNNYKTKYVSNTHKDSTNLSFYILSDNGGLEVFCEDFSVPFYILTLASPYSNKASLNVSGDVTISSLYLNEIGSIWRDPNVISDEGVLYLSNDNIHLDTSLNTTKQIMSYYTGGDDITWSSSNENVINYVANNEGVKITALTVGETILTASAANVSKDIYVKVTSGSINTDIKFDVSGIKSGEWIMSSDGLIGQKDNGDGFILSNDQGSDFNLTANFKLEAAAASIVFRSDIDMTNFIVANYDNNAKTVKLWSHLGVIATKNVNNVNVDEVVLSVRCKGNNVIVLLNGNEEINVNLTDQYLDSGYYGLNVFSGKATFKQITLTKDSYEYNGNNLVIKGDVNQHIKAIFNTTLKNTLIDSSLYSYNANYVTINEEYFYLLKDIGTYKFLIVGEKSVFEVSVNVSSLPLIELNDVIIDEHSDLYVFIGNRDFNSVKVNGKNITDYKQENYQIIISKNHLEIGDNTIEIEGIGSFNCNVKNSPTTVIDHNDYTPIIVILSVSGGVLLLGAGLTTTLIIIKKRRKNNANN